MGASVRYVPANGDRVAATVYIYGRGQYRQPEGGDSPDVIQELRATVAEMNEMVRLGRYRSAVFETGMDWQATPTSRSMRCTTFRITHQNGATTGDSVCIAVKRGKFVKVRTTSGNPPEPAIAGVLAGQMMMMVLEAQAPGTGR